MIKMNARKLTCMSLVVAAILLFFTGMSTQVVLADGPDIELPTGPIDATFVENFEPGGNSYFDTTLNNVPPGFGVDNGDYVAWCSDPYSGPPPYDHQTGPVKLYSTYGTLPSNVNGSVPWDKINYLLNHKNGQPNNVIQPAIWYLITGDRDAWVPGWDCPTGGACDALVQDAEANGSGFVPGPGQVLAVFEYVNGISFSKNVDDGWQDTIIEVPLGKLGDFVWSDGNANGIQNSGEAGIPDVTVNLLDPGPDNSCNSGDETLIKSTTTDGSGYYEFVVKTPRNYCVEFEPPTGFDFSPPKQGDGTNDSKADPNTGQTIDIAFVPKGGENLKQDAGLIPTAPLLGSISNRIWDDLNQNGIQDAGEPGMPGVQVDLLADCSGSTVLQTKFTNDNGNYSFNKLPAGQYRIQVSLPNGYVFSPQNQGGNDATDSDANTSTGISDCIDLAAGEDDPTNDVGIYRPAPELGSIGDRVWNDANQNGVQDPGEPGVANVTVQLKDCNGNVLTTTTTDGSGNYLFDNLAAGCYTIGVVLPDGYVFSPPNQGGNDATDSDINPANAMSDPIDLSAGEDDPTNDAGIYVPTPVLGSIGDRVWNDANQNGVQDPGEPGVANVTVQLKDCNGNVLTTTTTDGSGNYLFDNLAAGCYTIGVVLPDGYVFSPPNQGGNDATDSDINPANAMSDPIDLSAGEDDPTNDAGIYVPTPILGSIGDRVFDDQNSNGVQDPGEPGVANVTVQLKDCNGNVLTTTTTDGSGNYLFDNLAAGCYTIGVVLPDGRAFSPPNQGGDDATDSDINPANAMTDPVNLGPGENNPTVDAGLVALLTCGLSVTQTCEVPVPPSGNLECNTKIAAALFRYTGPSRNGVTVLFQGKDGQATYTNVNLVSGETILANQNGYSIDARPKDLGSNMSIFVNGVEEGIHTSCSAPFVAGQPAPLNSPKGAPSPNWSVEGFVDKDGQVVALPGPGAPLQQCTLAPGSIDVCSDKNKPTNLTFRYTGGGCAASNNGQKPGSATCTQTGGGINGSQAATVSVKNGPSATLNPGEEITLPLKESKEILISQGGATETNKIHTSCSQPLKLGDVYGSLTLVAADGQRLDTPVTFRYLVTNTGDNLSSVSLTDNFGSVAGPFTLATDEAQSFERTVTLEESTTNNAFVEGALANGQMCSDQSSTTVTVTSPPVGALSCADGKPIRLTFEYTGESCSASNNSQSGGKFSCSGTPGAGTISVSVVKDSDKISVDPSSAGVGDLVTFAAVDGKKMKSSLQVQLGGQTMDIHTSCSAPLAVGDQFGSLILREFIPEGFASSAATQSSGQTLFLPLAQR